MPKVTPFKAIRPIEEKADKFCALPYDVYNRKEACAVVKANPLSFLSIDRAETLFDDSVDTYAPEVYAKAASLLKERIEEGTLIMEDKPCFYVYELTMNGRSQSGIVACSSVDDYINGVICKHENTREEKEIDRINHVDTTNAHTGPIFLVYRKNDILKSIVSRVKEGEALYDFTSDDGIRHRAFIIDGENDIEAIEKAFESMDCTYIADGHHRCASAAKVGLKRRESNPDFDGTEGFNRFLSVLFPSEELYIMPYNRVVKDLNGYSEEEFLNIIEEKGFVIEGEVPFEAASPENKGSFGMLLSGKWYRLTAKKEICLEDPVKGLDVSILQDNLLDPVLGIKDPRTDKRIDFVGGIRGNAELVKRCDEDMKVAFAMYPTSIEELLDVADAHLLMPPKSTWFEPKLRSGMFIHSLDD